MSKIRICFIGCGGIAKTHLNILMSFPDVEIAGFYSNHAENAETFAVMAGQGKAYDDYIKMYENESPDAVYICTIPSAHGEYELEAIKRGIHIFVEKPISNEFEAAAKIHGEIEKSDIISCVGYQERYLDIIGKAKYYLESSKTGLVEGRWLGGIPGASWWRQKKLSGGQIVEQSTHIFDMLRYLLGEPEKVYSSGGKGIVTNLLNYDIDDYYSSIVTFKSGVVANIFTGCYFSNGLPIANGIKLYTSEATIEYLTRESIKYQSKEISEEITCKNNSFLDMNRTFIDAIKTGDRSKILSDYSDSLKTLMLTLACNESIRTGMPVYL